MKYLNKIKQQVAMTHKIIHKIIHQITLHNKQTQQKSKTKQITQLKSQSQLG